MSAYRLDRDPAARAGGVAWGAFGVDPRALQALSPADRFARLRERFVADAAFVSSLDEMVAASSFRDIVAMGRDALPFLLEDLRRPGAPWGAWALALREIHGAGPELSVHEAGRRDAVVTRWLEWINRPK